MLSDEEKQAIDKLKRSANYFVMPMYETKIILELIEKQSKEIEELKEIYQKGYVNGCVSKVYEINKKWEDKIKAKIKEIDKVLNEDMYVIDGHYDDRYYRYLQDKQVLQSLLEKE